MVVVEMRRNHELKKSHNGSFYLAGRGDDQGKGEGWEGEGRPEVWACRQVLSFSLPFTGCTQGGEGRENYTRPVGSGLRIKVKVKV